MCFQSGSLSGTPKSVFFIWFPATPKRAPSNLGTRGSPFSIYGEATRVFYRTNHVSETHVSFLFKGNLRWKVFDQDSPGVRRVFCTRFMDLGADIARERGYPYWKSLTTGKSVSLGARHKIAVDANCRSTNSPAPGRNETHMNLGYTTHQMLQEKGPSV